MFLDVVSALSSHASEGLARAGYPPLSRLLDGSPGRIIIIDRFRADQVVPPRVLMLPTRSSWGPRGHSRGPVPLAANAAGLDAESRAAVSLAAIGSEFATFEVACWSVAPDGLPDSAERDYVYTRALYSQVLASCRALVPGLFEAEGGVWRAVPHNQRVGREFVFSLTFELPVLPEIEPTPEAAAAGATAGLEFAPAGVTTEVTDAFVAPDGTSGPGCE